MSLVAGLLLGAIAGLALNFSYVVQHGALASAPPVRLRTPIASLRGLLASRRWLAGAALGYGGLALNIAAMALAPLWLVQSVIAVGLVAVCTLAAWQRGTPLAARERIAVGLVAGGVVALALSGVGGSVSLHPAPVVFGGFVAGAAVLAAAVALHGDRQLGLAAGILYGATTVALAALLGAIAHGSTGLAVAAVTAGAAVTATGFFAFQRGLQAANPAPVITQMTAAMNGVAITGGLLLAGGFAATPAMKVLQLGGLIALCAAATLAAGAITGRAEDAEGRGTPMPPPRPERRSLALDPVASRPAIGAGHRRSRDARPHSPPGSVPSSAA